MLEEVLVQEEGKILEFKENIKSLNSIIHTIIAFVAKDVSFLKQAQI